MHTGSGSRRLIICLDGTWDNADQAGAETNVARIAHAIPSFSEADGKAQIVLYISGVGSTDIGIERLLAGATGLGISATIQNAYVFLAQNYRAGDEIFLFGFSRGAFAARSLVGMIHAAGLLQPTSLHGVANAWSFYRDAPRRDAQLFAADNPGLTFHQGVVIDFIGVWDTVGSLGIPDNILSKLNRARYGFHDTAVSPIVRVGCHAVAIDEHRSDFVPTLWTGKAPQGCTIEQVWFVGCHADVGGGFEPGFLADIPLAWMASKAERAGLAIDWATLQRAPSLMPLSARHASIRGWFVLRNPWFRTVRRISKEPISLTRWQRLRWKVYTPTGEDGRRLSVINESIHPSAFDRLGRATMYWPWFPSRKPSPEIYAPINIGGSHVDPAKPTKNFRGMTSQ